ncbi:MAG: helix-hairpin-helix domain-containing protein [Bacteroidales bacterium]|nr:helix-hairpin-helix domain-containing protein [Bacteroidales bacterium]
MLKAIPLLMVLSILSNSVFSQDPLQEPSETIQSIMESMEENGRLPEDFSDMLDNLDFFRENPLNLNQAVREDLEKFLFLTDFQIQSLLDYRDNHGPILTLYELQLVIGYDSSTIVKLLPYVTAGDAKSDNHLHFKPMIRKGTHEVIAKEQRILQTPEGYKEIPDSVLPEEAGTRYPGCRDRFLLKYRYHCQKRIFLALTMEKDAGEEFFTGSNRHGFDFYSGYIRVNNIGPFKSILIGDYQITAGQGLTLWTGQAFGKSMFPSAIYRRQECLKNYGSTDESLFFRGITTSLSIKHFTCLAFFSAKPVDANITDTLTSGTVLFSSFQETGYHRTAAEISDENALSETATGGLVLYKNNWLKLGSTVVAYFYSGKKQKPEELYRKYEFWGDRLLNAGLDYSLSFRKLQLFGEISWGNKALATLNGAILNAHQRVSFSLLQRYYDPQYYARYSTAISENTHPCNENAIYLGTVFNPFRYVKITAYADFFRFPWLTYTSRQPSSGSEVFLQVDIKPNKDLMFYLRFKNKNAIVSYTDEDSPIKAAQNQKSNAIRLHCSYKVNQSLQLRSRAEYKNIHADSTGKSEGFMLYQDIVYRFSKIPLQLSIRYMLYKTDDYASRIYAYEDDVLYSYSVAAVYDDGNRSYIVLRYDITKKLTLWCKWGQTVLNDASSLGTGLDEINGNSRSEIKLQVRWVF